MDNKPYRIEGSARPAIKRPVARVGAMFLGTKDTPWWRRGTASALWHPLTTCDVEAPTSYQGRGERDVEGGGVRRHCSHFEAKVVVPTQKCDYFLAAQGVKVAQQFGREYVAVAGCDVILNFIGAGPQESAEWALARWPVYFLLMPLELLDPPKLFRAKCAGNFHLGKHTVPAPTVASGTSNCCMLSSSQRLRLEHVSMHSNHGKPNVAYLVGWIIVL